MIVRWTGRRLFRALTASVVCDRLWINCAVAEGDAARLAFLGRLIWLITLSRRHSFSFRKAPAAGRNSITDLCAACLVCLHIADLTRHRLAALQKRLGSIPTVNYLRNDRGKTKPLRA